MIQSSSKFSRLKEIFFRDKSKKDRHIVFDEFLKHAFQEYRNQFLKVYSTNETKQFSFGEYLKLYVCSYEGFPDLHGIKIIGKTNINELLPLMKGTVKVYLDIPVSSFCEEIQKLKENKLVYFQKYGDKLKVMEIEDVNKIDPIAIRLVFSLSTYVEINNFFYKDNNENKDLYKERWFGYVQSVKESLIYFSYTLFHSIENEPLEFFVKDKLEKIFNLVSYQFSPSCFDTMTVEI